MTADRDSHQRIIYTEAARHIDFHIEIHEAGYVIVYAQEAWTVHQFQIGRPEIRFLGKAVGLHLTGMALQDIVAVRVVHIDQT